MADSPISVVVPAHNEQAVIARLLAALESGRIDGDQIVVVCDGCDDATASIARAFEGVTVVEGPHGGKAQALNVGDARVTAFPRFFVDADVVVSSAALHRVAGLMVDGVEAGAPRCAVDARASSCLVRSYYDVWTRLPYMTSGPLGAGVVGVTEGGRSRFDEFPNVIADDEYVRRLFTTEERLSSSTESFVISAPRTVSALINIKTRSRLGTLQLDQLGIRAVEAGPSQRRAVVGLARSPARWFPLAAYVAIKAVVEARARRRLRRRAFTVWERDETSRTQVSGSKLS